MAAMPFPCNGHLLCRVNIRTVLLMFFHKLASCSIPISIFISPKSEPALELHSRVAPSVVTYHHVYSPNTRRNFRGRRINRKWQTPSV